MSSQSPAANEEASTEVKEEPPTNNEDDVITAASPPLEVDVWPTKADSEIMNGIVKRLTEYKPPGSDAEPAFHFQRMISRKSLPDYYEVIKEPRAFSTIRGKILKKQYTSFKEYVRDFALIFHNAHVYNRPSALVFKDAVIVRDQLKVELQKLVDQNYITADVAELPYLGEIPEFEDSPLPDPDEEEEAEVEEEEDEDDEEEEEEDTDDDRPRRGRRKGGRRSSVVVAKKAEDGGKEDPEAQKKRGRPPKVHTPMEARINTILKGLRKFKTANGQLKILPFERLPDKTLMPDYFQEIKNPIAMDLIKRKAKRKKYQSVDQVLKDLDLMFDNAKEYNLDDSEVYKDAVDLQKEAHTLAEQEKKKPDSDFADEDGRIPLSEILHNGDIWKVGDWVHLTNGNDVTKPIVAQIYRTWQDPEGQKWINACWYYRPEQTVHRVDKHFMENEVVKTGQYRDHKIEEVVDRCFVMFFTRYNKGRPRGFPPDKEVYVCEARYNEEKFKLNKIKTWASCVPDEVREKDYEMDLYEAPRKLKKVESPIKHLLREDAKEDDPLPKPTWGVPNAPPIVGAVHIRPREANESPPPEPSPSPPPPSPQVARRPVSTDRQPYESQGDITMAGMRTSAPLPSPTSHQGSGQTPYGQQFAQSGPSPSPAPILQHQTSYGSHGSSSQLNIPQTPLYQPQQTYNQYSNTVTTPVTQHANPTSNYGNFQPASPAPRPVPQPTISHGAHSSTNAYNPPRPIEVYTLPDAAVSSIPADIRSQFHHDETGRVIFYTTPPLDANPIPEEKQTLGHSLRYLADKARNKAEDEKKRKAYAIQLESEATDRLKRIKTSEERNKQRIIDQKFKAMNEWCGNMDRGTDAIYKQIHGDEWKEVREIDLARLAVAQEESFKKQKEIDEFLKKQKNEKDISITGFRWI